jgi:outer membrane protein assembly factor BamB
MSEQSTAPRRRWFIPIICGVLFVAGFAVPAIWESARIYPAWQMFLTHAGVSTAFLAVLVAVLWFFFLGGFRFVTKMKAVGLAMLLLVVGSFLIREVDFNGDLRPIPRFRWEASAQELFDRSRKVPEGKLPEPSIESDLTIDPVADFPRFRGPRGDGIVTPPELFSTDWEKNPPAIVWRKPCGGGFSAFAVAGDSAITLEQRRGEEALVCYDRKSGEENWVYSYKAHFRDIFGDGPRATPTIHAGRVYSLGATGTLVCVDGTNGKEIWTVDALNAGRPTTWGTSGSPLIAADLGLVIVAPGGRTGPSVAAYDLDTGERKWQGGKPGGGYSSPVEATLVGRRQVLIFDAGGLAGFDITNGEELWRHPWKTFQDMNITQPTILDGDRVFISSEASNGCALLRIAQTDDGYESRIVWENKDMASKFSNPVAVGGAIYGLSHVTLVCLDQQTGKQHWRGRRYGHGQILAVGGTILILSERGAVALVAADTKAFAQLAFLEVFKDKTWNTPALAGRHLFIRNAREMACVELPKRVE